MNVISNPAGAENLVIIYHTGGSLSFPGAVVATEVRPGFSHYDKFGPEDITPLPDAIAQIGDSIGRPGWQPSKVILAGFSAGCQGVRTQLRGGYTPSACVAIDGTHSATPPAPEQINPWKTYADAAKSGSGTFLASCSTIDPPNFESSRATLRRITGFPMEQFGTVNDPVITREGNLIVYAVEGKTANDHVLQAQVLLPRLINEALTMALPGSGGGSAGHGGVAGPVGAFLGFGVAFAIAFENVRRLLRLPD